MQTPQVVQAPTNAAYPKGGVYDIGRKLGDGGFAVCYSARLRETGCVYALKITKPDESKRINPVNEIRIHSGLQHRNVVLFHNSFVLEDSIHLVLELCPNGTLWNMIERRLGITEPEVRFYTIQIAGALKYIHKKGIIHRDIKPDNIFLDYYMNAKVGDFGLAALGTSNLDGRFPSRFSIRGTPGYMAPELMVLDDQGYDHSVDIWSCGVMVFEMLTCQQPFASAMIGHIYQLSKEGKYDWPNNKIISSEVKDLVATILVGPARRPSLDALVQHRFFTSGYTPSVMRPSYLRRPPMWPSMNVKSYANLKRLYLRCSVGGLRLR